MTASFSQARHPAPHRFTSRWPRPAAHHVAVAVCAGVFAACSHPPFPLIEPPSTDDHDTASHHPPTDTGHTSDSHRWIDPSDCETNALAYTGHEEAHTYNSFAWVSPDDGGIVVRAAITEPGGPTACELFSEEPTPYTGPPLVINVWAGDGNELAAAEVTMEEAKEEAPPPPEEDDGLGSDAVLRLTSGQRLRSQNLGQTYHILQYGPEAILVVDDDFAATFDDGSELVPGGWVACHCPSMIAFGSE